MLQDAREETQAAVYAFLADNFPLMRKREVAPEEMLLDGGIIDSLGLLLVVEFIETTYALKVEVEHMVVENFGSVGAITNYILRRREGLGEGSATRAGMATAEPEQAGAGPE